MPSVPATVYVVDYYQPVRDSLRLVLELHHFNAVTFACLDEFQRRARAEGSVCALIDLRTAGMSGCELLHALDRMSFVAPVIIMTVELSSGLPPGRRGVMSLRKPFSAPDLIRAVQHALELCSPH